MTTMDSDSESQDSDEGRRFRFEATRKDSLTGSHSRKRRSSPSRTDTKRRSRSVDRSNRDRRNDKRVRHDYKKKSRSSSNAKRFSRDGDRKHSKEIIGSTRGGSRYKDSKGSKISSNSTSSHKELRVSRKSPLQSLRKESRTRERDRRRSDERSSDRSYDNKQLDKYTNKSCVRNKQHSRERSREQLYQGNKPKTTMDLGRSRDEVNKTESMRKISRKDSEIQTIKDVERNLEEANINSETDSNSRASSLSSRPECKNLNFSDFDIVSDIEEGSSDNSSSRQRTKELTRKRGENSLRYGSESGMKKRVSKQQYERLLKRQAVKNRRSLEELHKVKAKNGDYAPGTSNNNRSAVSHFLYGTTVATTAVAKLSANVMHDSNVCPKESRKCHNNDKDENESNSDNSQSNSSTYGPILLPKIANTSCFCREGKNDKVVSQSNEKETIAPRIIGPTLPAHLRQCVGGSEIEVEDTFGPALPPYLEQHEGIDQDSEDESMGLPVLTGNVLEKEDSMNVNQAECEANNDHTMGPLPPDHPALASDLVQQQLELRARRLKAELAVCDNKDEKKREEWMIELPLQQSVNLGLGPRKFRVRPAPDMSDRSSWTDTPADRARKRMEKFKNGNMVCKSAITQERDSSNAGSEAENSSKRQKSLLEIHQKKLHKKKKEEKEAKKTGKTVNRRPFDRDVDLQANRFDEARKKNMLLKARGLNDRFSRGKI